MTTMTPKELSKEEVDALEKYCNERNPWEEFTLRCLILTIRQMEKKVFFAFEAGHYAASCDKQDSLKAFEEWKEEKK